MHPSDYPFVQNGPPCSVCGHHRVDHVRKDPRFGFMAYDIGCRACSACTSYVPVGIEHQELRVRDMPVLFACHEAYWKQMQRRRGLLNVLTVVVLGGAVASFRYLWLTRVLLVGALAALTVLGATNVRDSFRREEPMMACWWMATMCVSALPLLGFFVALPLSVYVAIVLTIVATVFIGMYWMRRDTVKLLELTREFPEPPS